jgi:hypothetical protein
VLVISCIGANAPPFPWGFILSPSATLRVADLLVDGERVNPYLNPTLTVAALALPGPSLSLRPRRRHKNQYRQLGNLQGDIYAVTP